MKKPTVAVLFGGQSDEYEISLLSAEAVLTHINQEKWNVLPVGITRQGRWLWYKGDVCHIADDSWHQRKKDLCPLSPEKGALRYGIGRRRIRPAVVLPILHGRLGEGGALQGLLDCLSIPYGGCPMTAAALGMDKAYTKTVLSACGIPTAHGVCLSVQSKDNISALCQTVKETVGFPLFIKPARGGSSLGACPVKSEEDLFAALRYALLYDSRILAEEYITGKECEVAVFEEKGKLTVSVPGEIESGAVFYDYRTKYHSDSVRLHVPARIEAPTAQALRSYAELAFRTLGCRHLCRFDFFVREDGTVCLNEVNTLPGLTAHSLFPALLAHAGISMTAFLDRWVEASL